jgi:CHAT domain-containing protein
VEVGEGAYGLRRAAVIASAESQLVTLWKVNDKATRELMIAYYKRLVAGEGRADALRAVQLEMLGSPALRHPCCWAGFLPVGAWNPTELPAARAADSDPPSRPEAFPI